MLQVLVVCIALLASLIAIIFDYKDVSIIGLVIGLTVSLTLFFLPKKRPNAIANNKNVENDHAVPDTNEKANYLAKISHDLRTPLHGINGLIEIIKNEELSPTIKRYIDQMEVSSQMLLGVISDAIDLSQSHTKDFTLRLSSFKLLTVCENVIRIFSQRASVKNISLNLHFDPRLLHEYIQSDPQRLHQILYNLLGNAFKYTDSGTVALWVVLRQHVKNELSVRFIIEDTGIGMEQADADRIFQEFYQVEQSQPGRVRGSGLGLKITGDLIQLLGGEIKVKSSLNFGSKFSFELVFQQCDENEKPMFRINNPDSLIILISNIGTVSESIVSCAQGLGISIQHFNTIASASAKIALRENSNVIIELDAIENIEEAERFCSLLKPASRHLLVSDSQIKKHPQWGLLFKPFLPNDIIEFCLSNSILSKLLTTPSQQVDTISLVKKLSAEKHPLQVLVADDIDINQIVLSQLLQQLGFNDVQFAANGKEALIKSSQKDFDIVFMDFDMPVMDGIDASREMRQKGYKGKVVGVTAASNSDILARAMDYMDLIVTKPVTLEKLAQLMFKQFFDKYTDQDEWELVATKLNTIAKHDRKESKTKILLTSADETVRSKFIRVTKQSPDFVVSIAHIPKDISLALQKRPYEILVIDTNIPAEDIDAILIELTQKRINIQIGLLIDSAAEEVHKKFKDRGVDYIEINKPVTPIKVCGLIEEAIIRANNTASQGRKTKLKSEG